MALQLVQLLPTVHQLTTVVITATKDTAVVGLLMMITEVGVDMEVTTVPLEETTMVEEEEEEYQPPMALHRNRTDLHRNRTDLQRNHMDLQHNPMDRQLNLKEDGRRN